MVSCPATVPKFGTTSSTLENGLQEVLSSADTEILDLYFGEQQCSDEKIEASNRIAAFLLRLSGNGEIRKNMTYAMGENEHNLDAAAKEMAEKKVSEFIEIDRKAQAAYRIHRDRFPTSIWYCCKKLCFLTISMDPLQIQLLDELILIHNHANRCHAAHEQLDAQIETRRRGVGTSTIAFVSHSRSEREAASGQAHGTARQKALREFASFVLEVLPFLYGKSDSPKGTARPKQKLCTQAICSLLGVSRNFLYNRMSMSLNTATEEDLTSVVDAAGVRQRQHRRNGDRRNYPPLQSLNEYDCGCDEPCFASVPQWNLIGEYNDFIKLAKELKPRHKENRFLLNRLFCPLSKSTTRVCNAALSALYTVSESLIADVRRALDAMCSDQEDFGRPLLNDGTLRYRYERTHPINRYPERIRQRVEAHLDIVLRADPSGSTGANVCRVYSPEINTQEKLREVLRKALRCDDESTISEVSSSTLQRMVKDYLKQRNCVISFSQSDHNACPNCKTMHYAVLQYHHEAAVMKSELDDLRQRTLELSEAESRRLELLSETIVEKRFQEDECVQELRRHNSRDGRIRDTVKKLTDHFRKVENKYRAIRSSHASNQEFPDPVGWNLFPDRAIMMHQDDMSKVDLPHFFVSASSDITRWRFDVNGHVSAVTNDAIVLSHEQGTGPKNASAIIEEILLTHLLCCRGESIKIIISDNAAVGKNWMTTVALPQYMVDQGLAEIVLVIFLENNHGKYLADMLFGQFQSRKRREVILGVDDMLNGFECINRKSGKVKGFAVNPLSSINFTEVFASLGYATKPPPDFGFLRRNIHFAAACKPGVKSRLPVDLRELFASALPDDAGMVRISTEPPGLHAQSQLAFEDRYCDVPAADLQDSRAKEAGHGVSLSAGDGYVDPVVIPFDRQYSPSGPGVVSTRTAEHVGFNGIEFRNLTACPEMRDTSKPLIRRAWPHGLLELRSGHTRSDEPIGESHSVKCAPLNWIVRKPVIHFSNSELDWKARYPPRNLLNAKFRKGPRDPDPWVPTATYAEPPFPIIEGTSACNAMAALASEYSDINTSVHVLHALKAVYRDMGDRDAHFDNWLQRRATTPSARALRCYMDEMKIWAEREYGSPRGARTLRQVFKEDEAILNKVADILASHTVSKAVERNLKGKTLTMLFEEVENTPGALDRFYHLVTKDQERYSRDLKKFRAAQRQFDADHGLLPIE